MRLLIIEDEPDLAEGLARGLRHHGYAVDMAYDGLQGWELASTNDYDLLILDLNLPAMDGLEVCRRVRANCLVKPFHFAELVARIRALLRRDMRARTPLLQYRDLKLDPIARVAWLGKRRLELTGKEFSILEYLMRHQGEVVSQEALLEHVWDMQANPLTNTVRVHINSLRRKLEDMAETPRYIETCIGHGYRLGTAKILEETR
jgi:DNA-binding response OmpR family regulator